MALPAADAALLRLKGGAKKEKKPDGYEAFQPPKRALTAYMIFSNKIRPELMKVCVRGPVVQKLGALLLCSCLILMLPSERRSACICVTGPHVVLRCLIGDVRAVQANPELKITEVSKHIADKWKVGLVVRVQFECLYAFRAWFRVFVCVFARMRTHMFKQIQALPDGDKAALQKQAEALKVAYEKKKAEYEAKVPAPMHSS